MPRADAVPRQRTLLGFRPWVFHLPSGISVLTIQLTVRRLAILHLHASNIEPWPPNVSL